MSKKIYEVTTKHEAYFTYWVEADDEMDAGAAAHALMDVEVRLNDEIDYEGDIFAVEDADDGHGHVFDADEVIRASEKGDDEVDRIWTEVYR